MITGLLSDYTESVKEYVPQGQKQSLWEQFFMGTTEAYQGLAEQTQTAYSYDISDAYANYKQQQLQLKVNEQLGAGFKQQAASQLQSEYGNVYQDIKSQEATALSKAASQYQSALEQGVASFEDTAAKLKQYDKLREEFGALAGVYKPREENMYTTEEIDGVITQTPTDLAALYYRDVTNATIDGITFDEWLASEESAASIDYETRLELAEFAKQNKELIAGAISGPTDVDYAAAEAKRAEVIYNEPTYREDIKLKHDTNKSNSGLGDNYSIEFDGETYRVEKGATATADVKNKINAMFKEMNGRDPEYGDFVIYQGKLYLFNEDNDTDTDEWSLVQRRAHTYANDYAELKEKLGLENFERAASSRSEKQAYKILKKKAVN